jgi:hypothetical protein
MALMHKLSLDKLSTEPMLKTKTLRFLDLIPERFSDERKHERLSRINLHFHFTRKHLLFQGRHYFSARLKTTRGICYVIQ